MVGSLCFVFNGLAVAADDSAGGGKLADLKVAEHIQQHGGEFTDMFVNLKQHPGFARLSQRYNLDDPAAWPEVRRRLVLNHAQLQGNLDDAESMAAVTDRRSGLNQTVVSAEQTRARGRELKEQLSGRMETIRHAVRLIDEMDAVLENVSQQQALTAQMRLENEAGQSFTAQVLLIDGNDLIVKGQEGGYFRVPAHQLSKETRLQIMQQVLAAWEALPDLSLDQEQEESDPDDRVLLAFGGEYVYLKQSDGRVVGERRSDSGFDFVPYSEQIESARESAARATQRRGAEPSKVERLESAQALNQSRLDAIERYEARLGLQYPVTPPQ